MVAVDGEVAVDAEVEDVVDADRVVVAVDVEVEDVVDADRVGVAAVAAVTPDVGRTGGPNRGFSCPDVADADARGARVVVAVDVEDFVDADLVGVAAVAAVTPDFGRTGGPNRGFGCTTSSVGTRDRSPDPVGSDDFEGVDCGITLLDEFLGEIVGGIAGESIEYIE